MGLFEKTKEIFWKLPFPSESEHGSVTLSWTNTMRACDNKIRKERSSCPNVHVPAESIQMPLKPR